MVWARRVGMMERDERGSWQTGVALAAGIIHENPRIGSDGESEDVSGTSDEKDDVITPVKLRLKHQRSCEVSLILAHSLTHVRTHAVTHYTHACTHSCIHACTHTDTHTHAHIHSHTLYTSPSSICLSYRVTARIKECFSYQLWLRLVIF